MREATAIADGLPVDLPPLAVDIDGTLTDQRRALDPRIFPILRAWPAPVVIATGKAPPYPVALCEFLRIDPVVIAENGGVVLVERADTIRYLGDAEGTNDVSRAYRELGHQIGWGNLDIVNRWRETELAVDRDSPREPLERLAKKHGLTVVDTGFAYHVKSPDIDKGKGLEAVAETLDLNAGTFAAIGDSNNDVPVFKTAGHGIAVANAPERVRQAADRVTDAEYADGFLEAISWLGEEFETAGGRNA